MRPLLLLLCLIFSACVLAQTPPLSPEQTVRQLYQAYGQDSASPPPYFGNIGEKAIISTHMQNAVALNHQLTLRGDANWPDSDPLCECQDYENLVLESVAIKPVDETHVNAVVRFRPFADSDERVTQTLMLVAENDRWLIDDIRGKYGGVYQSINRANQSMFAKLASLQKAQPEDFVYALFNHLNDYSWPWTWAVSQQYRQAVEEYYQASFYSREEWAAQKGILARTATRPWPWSWTRPFAREYRLAVNSDNQQAFVRPDRLTEEMSVDRFYLYNNPICHCVESQLNDVEAIHVVEQYDNFARIEVLFSLKDAASVEHKEQQLMLHRVDNRWEIEDFIDPESGSLLKQMQAITRQRIWGE